MFFFNLTQTKAVMFISVPMSSLKNIVCCKTVLKSKKHLLNFADASNTHSKPTNATFTYKDELFD